MNWQHVFTSAGFLRVIATLILLTGMLAAMVWSRVSLLKNGTQVVLKTAPIDPRSLLRGYFVRLNYDISRLKLNDLPGSKKGYKIPTKKYGFKKHETVYVELRKQKDGFWTPFWVHRAGKKSKNTVYIRGWTKYYSCSKSLYAAQNCTITIRYGIEKFFAQKKRTQHLEDFARQSSKELRALSVAINDLSKERLAASKAFRERVKDMERSEMIPKLKNDPKMKELNRRFNKLYAKQRQLRQLNRKEMAKRFAVIVRLDQNTGEAGISGLQLDGKQIYEESLF